MRSRNQNVKKIKIRTNPSKAVSEHVKSTKGMKMSFV